MTMTPKQTIDRIQHILEYIDFQIPGTTMEDKQEALDYLSDYMNVTSDLNVRTLKSLLVIKKTAEIEGEDWRQDAKAMLLSKGFKDGNFTVLSFEEMSRFQKSDGEIDINNYKPFVYKADKKERLIFVK